MEFLDRRVVVPEAKFRAAQIQMPRAYERIAGTEPHRLLCIGFGLRKATQVGFRPTSRRIQTGGIWVDREPGIGSADRLIPAVGAGSGTSLSPHTPTRYRARARWPGRPGR